jgi:chromate transporter
VVLAIVGSTVATLGVITMPSVFMGTLIHFEQRAILQRKLKDILLWLRPALVGLIAVSAVTIGQFSVDSMVTVVWFGVALGLLMTQKVHPIVLIFLSALLGVILF